MDFKYSTISHEDSEIYDCIAKETERQRYGIELIASENYPSTSVLEACGSILMCKYAEGYPGKRYYGGCENIDIVEDIAKKRACKLFGAEHANVQPHSGTQANMAAYAALLKYGDTILAADLQGGGHLSHSSNLSFVSSIYHIETYSVDENGWYDYEEIAKIAEKVKPKLIVCGASAYPRVIDFQWFRDIADSVGAYLMVDMAHIAGLVAAGVHPSPVPFADIVTSTAHKSLRGPRSAFILCKEKYAKEVDKAVFPYCQGGPHEHIIAGKAVCFKEAMQDSFVEYQKAVLANMGAMVKTFRGEGINMVTGGTDNHLLLLDLRDTGMTGKELETLLGECGITVNKNMIPGDPLPPAKTSGIRLGMEAMTTRKFSQADTIELTHWIADIIHNGKDAVPEVKDNVIDLMATRYSSMFYPNGYSV